MKKEMLINVLQAEECRIAIVENGILEELYVERTSHETYTGNIYKGRIVNLEPSIQAAFVDFSIGRNGFLHVSDVEPRYYRRHLGDDIELGGRDRGRDPRRTVRPEDEFQSLDSPHPASPRGPRPPRVDRGRRDRDDRRSPASRSTYPTAPPISPISHLDSDFYPSAEPGPSSYQGYPESVVDISDTNMPTQRGGRPDPRRERPRRSTSGRDRGAPRPSRDRPRPPETSARSAPVSPPLYSAEDVIYQDPFYQTPDYTSASYRPIPPVEEKPPQRESFFEPIQTEPPVFEEFQPEPPIVEPPPPPPPPVVEVKPPVPPPEPVRPSFVTRVRRAFGSGLEDWDTQTTPASSRPVLTPVPPPQPVTPPDVTEPQQAVTKTVTRSIPPAPPREPSKSRFGSGLLDESEEPQAQLKPDPSFHDFDLAESTRIGDYSEPLHSFEKPQPRSEFGGDAITPDNSGIAASEIVSTSEQVSFAESWTQFTPTDTGHELADSEQQPAVEEPPSRSRGRKRTTASDRPRGRSRKVVSEPVEPEEIIEQVEEPLLPTSAESEIALEIPPPETEQPSRTIRGRDAIRARGGNRESRGPRHRVNLEPEFIEPSEPAEPERRGRQPQRRGEGRYIPRLERERRSTEPQPFEFSSPGPDFDTAGKESDLEPMGPDLIDSDFTTSDDSTADSDPRLQPRGRDLKNRRRRRRRRPGAPEGRAMDSTDLEGPESIGDDPDSPPRADLSAGWSELDWSGSPGAEEALSDMEPGSESSIEPSSGPSRMRGRQPRRRFRRNSRHMPEMGPAPGEDMGDDGDDDYNDFRPRSSMPDPDDIVEPELEEEIRREAEEIAVLEIELGIRQPGEIRESPRSGISPGGRSAGGGRGFYKPPIQEVFQRSDEVLVQVIKESLGTKGPTLSTYISIPGRYLVLMPGLNRVGVSRKIADEGQRRKLRDLMNQLNPPKGLGFIVRTAGVDRSKRELARDLAYLLRLWKTILRRIKRTKAPAPIYQESDMIIRTIRDIFNSEIDTIWIDEPSAFERAQEFLRNVMPKFVDRLKLYEEKTPLFHKYGIEEEIAKIGMRHVPLPDGGSIVIDQTEALVAIDVNSGNFRVEDDAERTAFEMNLRAAKEIARQLRLRDLGGVIVNDFIDMRDERHRRTVERTLRDAIRRDRARTKILRMSQFGLIEMTRQRIRPSIKRSIYEDCPHCLSQGVVKTAESMSIDIMRILALAANRQDIRRINITCSANVANYLNNRKRQELARIERDGHLTIHFRPEDHAPAEFLQIDGYGNYNTEIRLYPTAAMASQRRLPNTTSNAPAIPFQPSGHSGHHGHFH